MVSIDEELKAAKAAKAAIKVLLTATPKSAAVKTINKANHAAILNLSSGGSLNEARGNAGIALSNLLHGPATAEKVDKAKGAVTEWINQLLAT
jgi:dihydroxyacetone kinase-like predicted kinase